MKEKLRRLPDSELAVMQAVWSCDAPATRAEIESALGQTHPLATTTVLTLLSRLVERGFLRLSHSGKRNLYTPTVSRQDYLAAQSRHFVEQLCGGDLGVFAAALCDSGLSRDDIDELRDLLERGEL